MLAYLLPLQCSGGVQLFFGFVLDSTHMNQSHDRVREVNQARALLERDGNPRLQMVLLVAITGASGFIASYVLLQLGLTKMWVRYLTSFAVAYAVFLFLLWLWLISRAEDYANVSDFLPSPSSGSTGDALEGKGGEISDGGPNPRGHDAAFNSTASRAAGDTLSRVAAVEDLAIPLLVFALFATLILSSLWVVYSAPVLFAELLVDGAFAAGLYRHLRGREPRHWLETAVRRTFLPFAVAAVVVTLTGWLMTLYAPEASSIGDVLLHAKGVR